MKPLTDTDGHDRLILWYFIAFFAVIILANIILVKLAVSTFSGQVSEHPYEEGLIYNKVIAAEAAQDVLGWKSYVAYRHGKLLFELYDAQHRPLQWQKATATFRRPARGGMDFTVPLENTLTTVTVPQSGLWEIQVDTVREDSHYQTIQRLVIE